ncbi:hypothetical protein DL240_11990 [Lujinxingia litoralis]|uniref:Uncharacterized protein n=1 Tax=Lujinxingia litoralis TaxID=2211119 RepID=A0A328C5J0_9DELT|nr:hypothetical protein DL240_11990 [Lujinxingia litoralis]
MRLKQGLVLGRIVAHQAIVRFDLSVIFHRIRNRFIVLRGQSSGDSDKALVAPFIVQIHVLKFIV